MPILSMHIRFGALLKPSICTLGVFFLLGIGIIFAQPVQPFSPATPAEELVAPEPEGEAEVETTGDAEKTHWRLYLTASDQWAFNMHPFFSLTREGVYKKSNSPASNSLFIGSRITDTSPKPNLSKQILHVFPPFGIERIFPTTFFPRGIGVQFGHYALGQDSTDALDEDPTFQNQVKMNLYVYTLLFDFYIYNPIEAGINYFFGVGAGSLEAVFLATPFNTRTTKFTLRESVGITRLGLEVKGQTWGLRYALSHLKFDEVEIKSNPYSNNTNTLIDLNGTLFRIALFRQF